MQTAGCSGRDDGYTRLTTEVIVERSDQSGGLIACDCDYRRIHKAQLTRGLVPEVVERFEKEIGAGDKLDLLRLEQSDADGGCSSQIAASTKHRDDLEKHVLEEQRLSPLATG